MENTLKKMVLSLIKSSGNFVKSYPGYQNIRNAILKNNSSKLSDMEIFVGKYIAKPLNDINWQLSTSKIENHSRKYLPYAIKEFSKILHNVSRQVLLGIDEMKTPLSKNAFVTDPIGFVSSFPKKVLIDINKNMKQHKQKSIAVFQKFEKDMKKLHKEVLQQIGQYSGTLNGVTEKLLATYKTQLAKHLDPVIKTLDDVNKKVEKELKGYMVSSTDNKRFREHLNLLTKKAKGLRQKYEKVQMKYVGEMKTKLNELLTNKEFMEPLNKNNLMKSAFEKIDRKMLSKVLQSLNQDLEDILSNTIYPQLEILAVSIDKTVCSIKKNMSYYYVNNDKGQTIMWEMPGIYQKYMKIVKQYNGLTVSQKSSLTLQLPCPIYW